MTVETPVWILDASGNEEKMAGHHRDGFEKPVCLEPGKTLRLLTSSSIAPSGSPRSKWPFRFSWSILSLHSDPLCGVVTLVPAAN